VRNLQLIPELGYSSKKTPLTLEQRKKIGANVEHLLEGEEEAAPAPTE
jgi:DOPA 4,5-dioxygenase